MGRNFADSPTLFDALEHAEVMTRAEREAPVVEAPPAERSPNHLELDDFVVHVRRSKRRKRSVGAQLVGGVLTITVPQWMSADEHAHWVDVMSGRFRRKMSAERIDLKSRARTLARAHGLSMPSDIRWSDEMLQRWGSCTPTLGTIRISTRLAKFPDWVIDYVIVHELVHLDVPDHSDAFWELTKRYAKAERAIGYLIAKSGDEHE